MKILSIDTASTICSVAISEDAQVLYEKTVEDGLTHSQNLMPMINETFEKANLTLEDIDLFACDIGPGSFTGIRIGISTIKAFQDVTQKVAIGVSSLESLAYGITDSAPIVTLLDARNNNIYGAVWNLENGIYTLSHDYFATSIEEASNIINTYSSPILVGDGSFAYYDYWQEKIPSCRFAEETFNNQNAILIAKTAYDKYIHHVHTPVAPLYLRKSQAERMLENKENEY